MASREVLTLNESTPRIEVPQSGDTYLIPRTVEWTTGVNTSNVANGASAVAFTLDTAGAYTANNGHRLLSVRNGGTERLGVSYGTTNQATGTTLHGTGALVFRPSSSTTEDFEYAPFVTIGVFVCRATSGMTFYNYVANGASAVGAGFLTVTNLTTAGASTARFAHNNGSSGIIDMTKDGSVKATGGLGLWGATTNLTTQYNTAGGSSGFGGTSGTTVGHTSTFTGNSGSKAYTINDIVLALKQHGIMAAS